MNDDLTLFNLLSCHKLWNCWAIGFHWLKSVHFVPLSKNRWGESRVRIYSKGSIYSTWVLFQNPQSTFYGKNKHINCILYPNICERNKIWLNLKVSSKIRWNHIFMILVQGTFSIFIPKKCPSPTWTLLGNVSCTKTQN